MMRKLLLRPYVARSAAWLVLGTALPALWMTCGADQGWGGDYAGYLIQAREITRGHTQLQPYYLYNPAIPWLAPPAYPPGLSLLEALFFRGNLPDISFFIRLNTVLWWLGGLSIFGLWRRQAPLWVACGTALVYLFNPYGLILKQSVLPDILFVLLTWWAIKVYLYRPRNSWPWALGCGALAALAWLTRGNGILLPLAICLHQSGNLIRYLRNKGLREAVEPELRFAALAVSVAVSGYCLVRYGIFPVSASGSYFDQMPDAGTALKALGPNAGRYLETLLAYFQLNADISALHHTTHADDATALGGAVAVGLIAVGILLPGKHREGLIGVYVLISSGLLLVWPMTQGFRYALPVIPGLLFYLLRGFSVFKGLPRFRIAGLQILLLLLLAGEYYRAYSALREQAGNRDVGAPEDRTNQEAFVYVRTHTPDSARFAYHHPLILGLYAERRTMRWRSNPPEVMRRELAAFKTDYLLINNWVGQADPDLQGFLRAYQEELDTIWHNERNCLYRLNFGGPAHPAELAPAGHSAVPPPPP